MDTQTDKKSRASSISTTMAAGAFNELTVDKVNGGGVVIKPTTATFKKTDYGVMTTLTIANLKAGHVALKIKSNSNSVAARTPGPIWTMAPGEEVDVSLTIKDDRLEEAKLNPIALQIDMILMEPTEVEADKRPRELWNSIDQERIIQGEIINCKFQSRLASMMPSCSLMTKSLVATLIVLVIIGILAFAYTRSINYSMP